MLDADECKNASGPSDATAGFATLDCIEWLRVFRVRYDACLDQGKTEAAEAVEYLFYAMWNGYGGECSKRWCDLIGAPVEDGTKVLHQEAPYECLRSWLNGQNATAQPPR
jgi:hypothetical protein